MRKLAFALAVALLLIGAAGCIRRAAVPPRAADPAPSGPVCGTNGKTYATRPLPHNVAFAYEGECRRCESTPCAAESEQCVLMPCPYREGPAAEEECLVHEGPSFCMPAR